MHKIAVLAAGLTCLFLPVTQAVPITSGFAEITSTGSAQFSLTGPGFSFTGNGVVTTLVPCGMFGPCGPGTTVAEYAAIAGEDRGLNGTFTFRGRSFGYTALPGLITTAGVDFLHTFEIPMVGEDPPETLILRSHFRSSGGFLAAEGRDGWEGPNVELLMTGQGIVTVHLQLLGGQPEALYEFQGSRYEFTIPEPGTGTLILPALAGLCFFCLRRRRSRPCNRIPRNTDIFY